MEEQKRISVEKTAEIMGKYPRFVRYGLQQGVFPFGFAVKMGKKWSYVIYENKFLEWFNTENKVS